MPARAVWALGIGQLVNWGVLYYAFAVLLVPLEHAIGAPRWIIAGAFSASLLVSALTAQAVGRMADRGHGPKMLLAGGLAAAVILCLWAAAPSIWTTYLAWVALGLCMAAVLYEPVFVIVGKAFTDGDARLRAIASVTVMGGLASTVFLPVTSAMVVYWGWRFAVVVLAGLIATVTLLVNRLAFRLELQATSDQDPIVPDSGDQADRPDVRRFALVFALSSVVNSALAANLVAALIERELSPTIAATIAGLFGILQLPGRVLMTRRAFVPRPYQLLLVSFSLQAAGLLALIPGGTGVLLLIGVMVFAAGAGLTTLVRPYLVFHVYGIERAGFANGAIARAQQLARACGPVAAAAAATLTGYGRVFAGLATLLAVAMMLAMKEKS